MKKYIIISIAMLLIYLQIVASSEMKIIGLAIFYLLILILFLGLTFFAWYGIERMRMIRARRIEAEKQAHVMTVTNNGQVFIRETNHKAWWRAAHLDNRVYANGQNTYNEPDTIEIDAWNKFNRQKTIEKLLPAKTITIDNEPQPETLYDLLDSYPHLMLIGGTNSGKTTTMRMAVDYLSQKYDASKIVWLSTHANLDTGKVHPQAKVIQEPEMIARALQDIFTIYEKRRNDATGKYIQIILALDEWPELIDEIGKDAGDILRRLSRGGRKCNISLVLASHGGNVSDLGIKGFGSVKTDFAEVYLSQKMTERNKAYWQQFNKMSSRVEIVLPDIRSILFKQLVNSGMSKNKASKQLYNRSYGGNLSRL